MERLRLSDISLAGIRRLVHLHEDDAPSDTWLQVDAVMLTSNEQRRLQDLQAQFVNERVHLFNEATLWSRVIYPLLILAEQKDIRAWTGVPLRTRYPQFELEGMADGVLGKSVASRIEVPYLVVLKTKQGVEATNPVFQLYGQLLAAARLNWEDTPHDPQEIFGCYTIADSWTFMRAEVEGMEADQPTLRVENISGIYRKGGCRDNLKDFEANCGAFCGGRSLGLDCWQDQGFDATML